MIHSPSKSSTVNSNFRLGLKGTPRDILMNKSPRMGSNKKLEVNRAPKFDEEFNQEEKDLIKMFMPDFV